MRLLLGSERGFLTGNRAKLRPFTHSGALSFGGYPIARLWLWVALMHDFSHRSHGIPRDVRIGSQVGYLEARLLDKRAIRRGEIGPERAWRGSVRGPVTSRRWTRHPLARRRAKARRTGPSHCGPGRCNSDARGRVIQVVQIQVDTTSCRFAFRQTAP